MVVGSPYRYSERRLSIEFITGVAKRQAAALVQGNRASKAPNERFEDVVAPACLFELSTI